MAEYISREAVNDIIEDMRNNHFILMCERVNLALLKSKVAEIPSADVQPVRYGRWVECCNELDKSVHVVIRYMALYMKENHFALTVVQEWTVIPNE